MEPIQSPKLGPKLGPRQGQDRESNFGARKAPSAPVARSWLTPILLAVMALALLPIVSLIGLAISGSLESLTHIANTVLWSSLQETIVLLVGVAVLTASMGAVSAWLVSFYDFPGRRVLNWALMLPLSVPTYISAYAYVEFAGYTGPAQSLVRNLGGFQSPRDYWFPEIRSLSGAIFILSVVLYPYVYLSVRTLFHFQSSSLMESARILGISQFGILRRVLLPLARPAIILGVTLALMESINDIGAIGYLGTKTLTYSIYSIWFNRDDVAGAAQLALLLLMIAFFLVMAERAARKNHSHHESRTSALGRKFAPMKLIGFKAILATLATAMPLVLGFIVPVYVLIGYAQKYWGGSFDAMLIESVLTSVGLSSIAAILTVLFGLAIAYAIRISNDRKTALMARMATVGYAIPGTIIALGIFLPIAKFDNQISSLSSMWFGVATGLLISSSGATIVYAYSIRFLAMAEGALDSAFAKLSPRLDQAARSLGKTEFQTFLTVLLPIMRPAIGTAALFVFIESMKELSATILLRPAGINTVSTYIYDYASRARVEEAATACLLIVAIGTIPVALLVRNLSHK